MPKARTDAVRKREREYKKRKRLENRIKLFEYLLEHPCVDCGTRDLRVLQFDHVSGVKTDDVSRLTQCTVQWDRILQEINKCQVRCANCHAKKTFEERGFTFPEGIENPYQPIESANIPLCSMCAEDLHDLIGLMNMVESA